MFIEPAWGMERRGWIEVITGAMFSGKTEELLRRLKRARIATRKVEIFKAHIDKRYHHEHVVSHDNQSIHSTPIENSASLPLLAAGIEVIGIDEAQFLDAGLPEVCEELALKGSRVIVAGLDMDYEGKPFGPMPGMLAVADYITKLHAICVKCGDIAHFSYRLSAERNQILIGEKDKYEARCRNCYYKGDKA